MLDMLTNPAMLATVLAAISVFVLIFSVVGPMLERERVNQRVRAMATERSKIRSQRLTELSVREAQRSGRLRQEPKGYMQMIVEKLNLRAQLDTEDMRNRLRMAGLRGQAPVVAFMFFRIAAPPAFFLASLFYLFVLSDFGYGTQTNLLISVFLGAAGYYAPNIFIENLIQKRRTAIKMAFPDALDMLLICVQSGMTAESAFGKVAREITSQSIELAEELSLTNAELSFLQDRKQAYENLAKRTGLPTVKGVCTALIQAEKYGTAVSQALRVMAKENRDTRLSEAEAKAAALPPKLTVPMILFFLPVLFVIILAPAAINYYQMP